MHLNQESTVSHQSDDRGPSWHAQLTNEPVWMVRSTLDPRPIEEDHLLYRHQFDIHLGSPLQVALNQNGKRLERVAQFGDVTWTPAGDSCRATWTEKKESGFVTFSDAFVQQAASETGVKTVPDYAFTKSGDPLTRELLLALVSSAASDRIYAHSLASSLIVHLLKSTNSTTTLGVAERGRLNHEQLRRAMEYVEDQLAAEVDLASWAREARLSPFHFSRMFKRTTGFAPHQFVQQRRIERAKTLLTRTDLPFSSLAYDLGFANQSHFNRVFRQYAQMTPGEWRRLTSAQNTYAW